MPREFDLLGDPIPENHGKPGANGHTPTAESVSKVRSLLAADMDLKDIAVELGITAPTLRKHYFQNGKINVKDAKRRARQEQRAKLMLKLDEQVDKGNVSAIRTMKQILDEEDKAADFKELAQGNSSKGTQKKDPPMPKGKKDQLQRAATDAWESDPLLSGRPN